VTHDVIVVGSGFAGGVTAARLTERGMRVLILEREMWRGPAGVWVGLRRCLPRTKSGSPAICTQSLPFP
jgi:choline dehydrogenase-like flavoprotein